MPEIGDRWRAYWCRRWHLSRRALVGDDGEVLALVDGGTVMGVGGEAFRFSSDRRTLTDLRTGRPVVELASPTDSSGKRHCLFEAHGDLYRLDASAAGWGLQRGGARVALFERRWLGWSWLITADAPPPVELIVFSMVTILAVERSRRIAVTRSYQAQRSRAALEGWK